jgi:predicted dehydrogenase
LKIKKYNQKKNIIIIGYGLIGKERVKALLKYHKYYNIYVFDSKINNLNQKYVKLISFKELLKKKFYLSIIATPHDKILYYVKLLKNNTKSFLLEKPGGKNLNEVKKIKTITKNNEVFVGFNYRFFKAIKILKSKLSKSEFGDLINIKFCIAHGGSPNLNNSWKIQFNSAGGGVILDPGIHAFDLFLYLFNDLPQFKFVEKWNGFWKKKKIEEEVFILSKFKKTNVIFEFSIVRWRSDFKLHINGKKSYARIDGRGKSYGEQTYIEGKRWGWLNSQNQKKSEKKLISSNCSDSFSKEIDSILKSKSKVKMNAKIDDLIKSFKFCNKILKHC